MPKALPQPQGVGTQRITRSQAQKSLSPKPVNLKHTNNIVPIGAANIPQKKTNSTVDSVKNDLRKARETRVFNAEPSILIDSQGVCRINTGRMASRSQCEVYNYAFLVNNYIAKQKGQRVKIKGTSKHKTDQADFCSAVRKMNGDLFGKLNSGKGQNDNMFSVVGHVPDQCIYVFSGGQTFNQNTFSGTKGIGQAPGWMPMTKQANGLVAKIFNVKGGAADEKGHSYLTRIEVDGLKPICLLPIEAVTKALGHDPYVGGESMDEDSEESGGEDSEDE